MLLDIPKEQEQFWVIIIQNKIKRSLIGKRIKMKFWKKSLLLENFSLKKINSISTKPSAFSAFCLLYTDTSMYSLLLEDWELMMISLVTSLICYI